MSAKVLPKPVAKKAAKPVLDPHRKSGNKTFVSTSVNTTRQANLTEGTHRFKVVEFEEREGPSGPYWNYTLEVAEGSPFAGQKTWVAISLSDKARWKLDQWLDAFSIPEDMEIEGDIFLGLYLRGTVVKGERDGKPETKIDNFLPDSKASKKKATQLKLPIQEEETDEDEEEDQEEGEEETEEEEGEEETDEEEEDEEDEDEETGEEDDEEDEDEEEEEPVKLTRKPSKPSKPVAKPAAKKPSKPVTATKGLPPARKVFRKPRL